MPESKSTGDLMASPASGKRGGLPGGTMAFIVSTFFIAVVVLVVALRGGSHSGAATSVDYQSYAASAHNAGTAMPPWPAPTDPTADVTAAGLTLLSAEGTAAHYHAHLDIFVNGSPVPVAAGIGIDEAAQSISPLHTHDTTGAIHIESPATSSVFYLGQLFTEWNVALSSDTLGGLTADGTSTTLKAYVNGQPYSGDPAGIVLKDHEEIALVYGPADQQVTVPSTYNWGNLS